MSRNDNSHLDARPEHVLPFPMEYARSIETPSQHLRRVQSDSNRRLRALAERLNCLGWFDPPSGGPRAA
jgi:hypothetical protein